MKYLLDTNAVAALMRGDAAVIARLERQRADDVGVPQPVWAEIAYGIERLPASRKRQRLQARFELLRGRLASVSWSLDVSLKFGSIKAILERRGARIEDFDAAIAAHAVALDATLVTANHRHLGRVEHLSWEDWS